MKERRGADPGPQPAGQGGAKGRVERRNGLLQDRLATEMRRRGISGIEAANAFPDGAYLAELNRAYAVAAADPADAHRAAPAGTRLDEVPCEQAERAVGRDRCVR